MLGYFRFAQKSEPFIIPKTSHLTSPTNIRKQTPTVTPTASPKPSIKDNPKWQTYKNSELGFEFSYPAVWGEFIGAIYKHENGYGYRLQGYFPDFPVNIWAKSPEYQGLSEEIAEYKGSSVEITKVEDYSDAQCSSNSNVKCLAINGVPSQSRYNYVISETDGLADGVESGKRGAAYSQNVAMTTTTITKAGSRMIFFMAVLD